MLLADAIDGYWIANERNLRPGTIADYSATFRRLAAYLAARRVDAIEAVTADHINGFLNDQAARGLSQKTILNYWIALSALWTWAEREIDIPHIVRRVSRPRPRRTQPEPYTADEIRSLLDAAEYSAPWIGRYQGARSRRATALRDRAIMLLLLDSGLRASEICALRLDDYDRRTGRAVVRHGKGDKERVVYAGHATRQAIWRYLQDRMQRSQVSQLQRSAPLFATNTGAHLDRSQLLHMIRNCAQRAGVDGANVHRFRHTFAVTMLRNGASAFVVQQLLGHEDMSTVRVYIKLAEIDLEQAMRAASPADAWRL